MISEAAGAGVIRARAAVKAGATLAQVLQVIQYVELTGMVKWVMVGHDALTAAEADVPDAQRLTPAREAWTGQEQRLQDMQQYLRRDGHAELSPQKSSHITAIFTKERS